MFLTTQELTALFKEFDHDGNWQIHYREFIETLRNDFNDKRLAAVKHAWTNLAGGDTSVEGLQNVYNAADHPRVWTREKTQETVSAEFAEGIRTRAETGTVSEENFIDYYADLNACLPAEKDEYFVDMVLNTWGMKGESAAGAFVTPERLKEIETTIFEKVRQRTHGADDEGKTIKKTFRHFDLNGNGVICFEEFYQVLDAYGCVYKTDEISALFNKYDKDGSGKLDCEEFAGFIALMGTGKLPNPVFTLERQKPDQVLVKIRDVLKSRGAHGIRGIGRVFRRMDDSGDRKLDRMEFMWGLKENGHDLSPAEFERIFNFFDRNNVGKINYDDFLRAVRGEMNEYRVSLVKLAFDKLDNTGNGVVNVDDLKNSYNVEKHPKYISGEMSATEILGEFLEQWDTIKKDGQVNFNEFVEYYNDVSASIDRDDYFELMIRNAWHIPGGDGWTANTTIPRHLEIGPDGKQKVVMAKGHENFNYDTANKGNWGGDV